MVVASQVANLLFTSVWVRQESSVLETAQVSTTGGAAITVKVELQVLVSGAQVLVTVKVTVAEPPHLSGAPGLLFVKVVPQPPEKFAEDNQEA